MSIGKLRENHSLEFWKTTDRAPVGANKTVYLRASINTTMEKILKFENHLTTLILFIFPKLVNKWILDARHL